MTAYKVGPDDEPDSRKHLFVKVRYSLRQHTHIEEIRQINDWSCRCAVCIYRPQLTDALCIYVGNFLDGAALVRIVVPSCDNAVVSIYSGRVPVLYIDEQCGVECSDLAPLFVLPYTYDSGGKKRFVLVIIGCSAQRISVYA